MFVYLQLIAANEDSVLKQCIYKSSRGTHIQTIRIVITTLLVMNLTKQIVELFYCKMRGI